MPTLLGVPASPFVRKVRFLAAEKGVEYETETVFPGGMGREGYATLHPLKKIPTWQDGDLVIPDSSAICVYLEKTHPTPAFYPSEPGAYARAIWFEAFGDEGLVKLTGSIFFERFVAKLMLGRGPNEEVVEKAMTKVMPPLFDYLESQLGASDWLLGDRMTIADVATGTHFVNLAHASVAPDASRWPKTAAWAARFLAHPTIVKFVAEERGGLGL